MTSNLRRTDPGMYATGVQGTKREWDGQAWAGPAIADGETQASHAPRSLGRTFRRLPIWLVVGGSGLGLALSIVGVSGGQRNVPVLLVAGFIAVGGPILALILGIYRRLGLNRLATQRATWLGLVSGALAVGIAVVLERSLGTAVGGPSGKPSETLLLLAGPIEEVAKILLPLVLLIAGVALLKDPRIGVWTVLISSGLFGAIEGALYAAGLGGEHTSLSGDRLAKVVPGMTGAVGDAVMEAISVVARIWVELGHPLWTTGAAALIWLAVHKGGRALSFTTLCAIVVAAGLHSFNDGVLPLLPGVLPDLASIVWIVMSYVLWFRPLVRQLVPPTMVASVPQRWLPRAPK